LAALDDDHAGRNCTGLADELQPQLHHSLPRWISAAIQAAFRAFGQVTPMSGLGPARCAIGCGQPRLCSFISGITMVSTMVSIRSVGQGAADGKLVPGQVEG
jgi:hypothetical protein